jgi:hypothetical protein
MLTFQSAAAHRPISLGQAALKIATLQTGRHHLVLISVDLSCAMLARNGGFVDRLDHASSVNRINTLGNGWAEWVDPYGRNIGQRAKKIAAHFEVLGI